MSTHAVPAPSRHARVGRTPLIVGAAAGAVAFALGPALFTPSAEVPPLEGIELPLFIGLAVIEAVALAIGVAFAMAGRPLVATVFTSAARVTAVHLALTWALVSWWVHDGLHLVAGYNIPLLLGIEYGFHATLIVGAAAVALAVLQEARSRAS
ncbi:hypothetical protein [Sinomonas halotolerans]|uniref:Uncharacterized protein n=1 Tax=Sinomonas halotolerans TaxID=1644133 RepID=A0ABU9WYL7_9MICC